MEKTRSKLVKSKSSNSTLVKYNPMDQKSRSHATFQVHSAKKRGVYVEKKIAEEAPITTADIATTKEPVKAPKRPGRRQKEFLASVLSILSKSSAGTQYPDEGEINPVIKIVNNALNKDDIEAVSALEPEKRKKKFKSKILNSTTYEYPFDTFEVLQSKKNVVLTPSIDFSNDEDIEDIKWSEFLPRLVRPDSEELQREKDKKLSHLAKEVAEGRMVKDKRVTINDEPPTLVSQHNKHTTKDPGFYNFFVDLLETTFSVYNIKSVCDQAAIQSVVSSQVAFEMDEAVADKLHVAPEVSQPSIHSTYKEDLKREGRADYFQVCPLVNSKVQLFRKKANKPEFPKYRAPKSILKQPVLPKSVSMRSPPLFPQTPLVTQNRSFNKKNSKQMLLNKLKEQLTMEDPKTEDPQNLFQALKVLAKNKRKTEKNLRFERTPEELADYRSSRLLPRRNKLKSDLNKPLPSRASDFSQRQNHVFFQSKFSNHSLEVVNIDYDKYVRPKSRKTSVGSKSPTHRSPAFSPPESVYNTFSKSLARTIKQVIFKVKPLYRSKDISYERDEAL